MLAWALVFGVVGVMSVALTINASHASEHCSPGKVDCPCDKADCTKMASCLSHCMQIGGVNGVSSAFNRSVGIIRVAAHEFDRTSVDRSPGLDPPQH